MYQRQVSSAFNVSSTSQYGGYSNTVQQRQVSSAFNVSSTSQYGGYSNTVQQSMQRSVSEEFNYGAHPGITRNPLYTPEAITNQPQPIGYGPANRALPAIGYTQPPPSYYGPGNGHSNPGYAATEPRAHAFTNKRTDEQETAFMNIGPGPGQNNDNLHPPPNTFDEEGNGPPSNAGCGGFSVCLTIFKRIVSVLFIIGDVLIDWTSLADVLAGQNAANDALPEYKIFKFSFPNIDDAMRVLNKSKSYETELSECSSTTSPPYQLAVSYSGFVLFGAVYSLIQIINIIGETVREIGEKKRKRTKRNKKSTKKKVKSVGFQLLHGWTETFGALLFEDLPQNAIVFFYSISCKSKALNKTKTLVSMIASIVKNAVRKSTCKQKRRWVCCLYKQDIGCMNFTCLSLVCCSSCKSAQKYYPDGSIVMFRDNKPIEDVEDSCLCCQCIGLEWGYEVNCPPLCTCGSFVCVRQMGCCYSGFEDAKCCEWECYGCCGKRIDKDPIWIQKYITIIQLCNIALIVLYVLAVFFSFLNFSI